MIKINNNAELSSLYQCGFGYGATKAESHQRISKLSRDGKYSQSYISSETDRLKQNISSSRIYTLRKIEEIKSKFAENVLLSDLKSGRKVDTSLRDLLSSPINFHPAELKYLMSQYSSESDALNRRMIMRRAASQGYAFTGISSPEEKISRFNKLADAVGKCIMDDNIQETDFDVEFLDDQFSALDGTMGILDPTMIDVVPAGDLESAITAERRAEQKKLEREIETHFEEGFLKENEKDRDSGFISDVLDVASILGIDDPSIPIALKTSLDSEEQSQPKADPYKLRDISISMRENGNESGADNVLRIADSLLAVPVMFDRSGNEQFQKATPSVYGDRAKVRSVRERRAEQSEQEEG